MQRERQSPPANRGARTVSDDRQPILPPPTLHNHDAIANCHAVLVSTPAGRWSRRLYLSLHSAEKAMQRARDRGQTAQCILVELVPVPGAPAVVVGGEEL